MPGSYPVDQGLHILVNVPIPVADPGFPGRGGRAPIGGCGPLTWALFGENVCENERIGSHRGACAGHVPPRSANAYICVQQSFDVPSLKMF